MSDDRWERIWATFHAALEREEAERAGFVEEECGSDESLRSEVFELLRSHENAETLVGATLFFDEFGPYRYRIPTPSPTNHNQRSC